MPIDISVVIPTYKRPQLLERCLASLNVQRFDMNRCEILVADDAADPDVPSALREWDDPLNIVYVPVREKHGPAAARNRGWRKASAEIIAFTDDDCIPQPDWLAEGFAAMSQGASAVWGKLLMPVPQIPTDYEKDAAGLSRAEFVTANCFCKKSVLQELQGFDERFQTAWREDSDLFFRLLEAGHRVRYAPQALVHHPIRPAAWGVSVSQQRKSLFDALLFKKHPALYRQKISPAPPWTYYAIVVLMAASLVAALRHSVWGWVTVLLWLALTAAFAIRRLAGTSRRWSHIAEMALTSMLIPPIAVYWRLSGALRFRILFI